jgi:hypothetical protein
MLVGDKCTDYRRIKKWNAIIINSVACNAKMKPNGQDVTLEISQIPGLGVMSINQKMAFADH